MQLPPWLNQKVGPLPVKGWVGIVGVSILGFYVLQRRRAAKAGAQNPTLVSAGGGGLAGGFGAGPGGGGTSFPPMLPGQDTPADVPREDKAPPAVPAPPKDTTPAIGGGAAQPVSAPPPPPAPAPAPFIPQLPILTPTPQGVAVPIGTSANQAAAGAAAQGITLPMLGSPGAPLVMSGSPHAAVVDGGFPVVFG